MSCEGKKSTQYAIHTYQKLQIVQQDVVILDPENMTYEETGQLNELALQQ